MAALIKRAEVLKSINRVLITVEITGQGRATGRVVYVDSFGSLDRKREFRSIETMEEFVSKELSLDRGEQQSARETRMLDLIHKSLSAWEDEEDSVQEEHADLIEELKSFVEGH